MTLQQYAESIINSPEYRETLRRRAQEGTLPPDVELFLLEMADGRLPMSADRMQPRAVAAPPQSRTFALVRRTEEEQS